MSSAGMKRARHVLAFVIGIAIVIGLIHYLIGEQAFMNSLASMNPYLMLVAVAVYLGAWLVRTLRLVFLVRRLGERLGPGHAFRLHVAQFSMNVILPLKAGDFAAALALRSHFGLAKGAAVIIQTRVLDLAALAVFALVSLLFMDLSDIVLIPLVLVLVLLVGGMVGIAVFNRSQFLARLGSRLGAAILSRISDRPEKALLNFTKNYETLLLPGAMLGGAALSIVIWFLEALTFYLVALSLGIGFFLPVAVIGVVVGNLAKALPATPASIGIYESAVAGVLIFLGQAEDASTTAAILDHLVKNLFLLAVGLPNMPMLSSRMLKGRGAGPAEGKEGAGES